MMKHHMASYEEEHRLLEEGQWRWGRLSRREPRRHVGKLIPHRRHPKLNRWLASILLVAGLMLCIVYT